LHRVVYRSESCIRHDDIAGLDAIFRTSVRNNRRDSITGALALPDGKFVQVLEGRRPALDALLARLSADPRHTDIAVLGQWEVTARLFAGWAMARPDPTPLKDQAFRVVTEDGSGAQVVGVLLDLSERADRLFAF
jgi:hypothetical protein